VSHISKTVTTHEGVASRYWFFRVCAFFFAQSMGYRRFWFYETVPCQIAFGQPNARAVENTAVPRQTTDSCYQPLDTNRYPTLIVGNRRGRDTLRARFRRRIRFDKLQATNTDCVLSSQYHPLRFISALDLAQ